MRTAPLFISISGRHAAGCSVWRPQLTRGTRMGACCSAEPQLLPPPHPPADAGGATPSVRLRLPVCPSLCQRAVWSLVGGVVGLGPARQASCADRRFFTHQRTRSPHAVPGLQGQARGEHRSERASVGPDSVAPRLALRRLTGHLSQSPYCPQRRDRGGPRQCVGDVAAPRAEGRGGKGGSTSSPLNPDPPGTRDPGGPTRFII